MFPEFESPAIMHQQPRAADVVDVLVVDLEVVDVLRRAACAVDGGEAARLAFLVAQQLAHVQLAGRDVVLPVLAPDRVRPRRAQRLVFALDLQMDHLVRRVPDLRRDHRAGAGLDLGAGADPRDRGFADQLKLGHIKRDGRVRLGLMLDDPRHRPKQRDLGRPQRRGHGHVDASPMGGVDLGRRAHALVMRPFGMRAMIRTLRRDTLPEPQVLDLDRLSLRRLARHGRRDRHLTRQPAQRHDHRDDRARVQVQARTSGP